MPSCAVVGCKNSSRKKVKMCYIPREERIRQEWITRINRNNWVPSGTSAICQYHFEPHMWEKPREDGKLKLKYGAIPTIFGSRVFQVGNSQLLDGNGENINELLDGADNPSGIRDVEAHENNYDDEQCPTVVSTAVPNQGKRLLPDLPGDQIPQNQRILTQISTNAQSSHHSLNNNSVTNDNNSWSKSPDDETISDHSKSPEDETEKLEQPQQCNGILQQVSDAASSSSVECQPTTAQSSDQFDDDENFIKTCDIWSFINPGGNDDVDQNINSVAACSASVRDDVQNFEQHNSSGSFNETSHDDDVLQSSAENVTMDVLNNDCDSDEMACDTDDEDSSILQTAQPQHSPSKEELLERMKRMEKVYLKSKRMNSILKTRLRENRKTIKRLEKKVSLFESSIDVFRKIFNGDQIEYLLRNYKKLPSWCDETLVKAFALKFVCGTSGYEEILRQGLPYPSLRTLSRKLEGWSFESGPNEEIWRFLEMKVLHFSNPIYFHCVVVIDEFSIKEGERFNPLTGKYVGRTTLPGQENSEELAKNILVVMLAGIANRWKQIVEYYYTGSSVNGSVFKEIVDRVIMRAENLPRPLRVDAVVSDMGSGNQRMWSSYGINASRYSKIVNSCSHPCDPSRKLYFFHDVVHGFKNLKEGLKTNKFVTIPDSYVEKYELPNNVVQFDHFKDLCDLQRDCDLKIAPKLRDEYLDTTNNQFLKMRVKNSSHVLSFDVASGLEFISYKLAKEEYKTTAWFTYIVVKWFKLMTSRNLAHCLSKMQPERLKQIIRFCQDFIELFSQLKFGDSGHWKPFQTGILISTCSIMQLSVSLLTNEGFDFILPGRFTQDCLENVFFVCRKRQAVLDALQVVYILRMICVSQYMKWSPSSNYDEDDRAFMPDFLKVLCQSRIKRKQDKNRSSSVPAFQSDEEITLDSIQLNILHQIGGYLIHSIESNEKVCPNCIELTKDQNRKPTEFNELTRLRAINKEKLIFLNERTFHFFIIMEVTYQTDIDYAKKENCDLVKYFTTQFMDIPYYLPNCHSLKQKICQRYARFRLKIACKKDKPKRCYSSKTMAMHSIVQT